MPTPVFDQIPFVDRDDQNRPYTTSLSLATSLKLPNGLICNEIEYIIDAVGGDTAQRAFATAEYRRVPGAPLERYYLVYRDGLALLGRLFSNQATIEIMDRYLRQFRREGDKPPRVKAQPRRAAAIRDLTGSHPEGRKAPGSTPQAGAGAPPDLPG